MKSRFGISLPAPKFKFDPGSPPRIPIDLLYQSRKSLSLRRYVPGRSQHNAKMRHTLGHQDQDFITTKYAIGPRGKMASQTMCCEKAFLLAKRMRPVFASFRHPEAIPKRGPRRSQQVATVNSITFPRTGLLGT